MRYLKTQVTNFCAKSKTKTRYGRVKASASNPKAESEVMRWNPKFSPREVIRKLQNKLLPALVSIILRNGHTE